MQQSGLRFLYMYVYGSYAENPIKSRQIGVTNMLLPSHNHWKGTEKLAVLLFCAFCMTSCFLPEDNTIYKLVHAGQRTGEAGFAEATVILFILAAIGHFLASVYGTPSEKTHNIYDNMGSLIGQVGTGEFYSGDDDGENLMHSWTFIATFIPAMFGLFKGSNEFLISGVICVGVWFFLIFFYVLGKYGPISRLVATRPFVIMRRIWFAILGLGTLICLIA